MITYKNTDLSKYNEFIDSCRIKCYEGLGTHNHHIIPKFMGGKNNKENLIILSYEDHVKSHIILANCFNKNTDEYRKNIYAGSIVTSWMIITPEQRSYYNKLHSEAMKGHNNPRYGKPLSEEKKLHLSKCRKGTKISEETRLKISKWGKGRKKSDEMRRKLSISKTKPKILLAGVFLDQQNNKYYRVCTCGKIKVYKTLEYANGAQRSGSKCKNCMQKGNISPIKGRKIGPRKYKAKQPNRNYNGKFNANAKRIIDLRNDIVFDTVKEYRTYHKISETLYNKHIKMEYCKILGKSS